MSIEAMKMALEALERYSGVDQRACDAEEALRAAIEQATQPDLAKVGEVGVWGERQWQGLTDEEQIEIMKQFGLGQRGLFADAIEAKLKGKNA